MIKLSDLYKDKLSYNIFLDINKAHEFYNIIKKRKGYVYAMSNPLYPNLLKIGRTSKNPFERAKTLSSAGVLDKFDVLWVGYFANSSWAENKIHKVFKRRRFKKEYFEISIEEFKVELIKTHQNELNYFKYLNHEELLHLDFNIWFNNIDIKYFID